MKSRHGKLPDPLKEINLAKAHQRAGALLPLFGGGILAHSHALLGGDLVELVPPVTGLDGFKKVLVG